MDVNTEAVIAALTLYAKGSCPLIDDDHETSQFQRDQGRGAITQLSLSLMFDNIDIQCHATTVILHLARNPYISAFIEETATMQPIVLLPQSNFLEMQLLVAALPDVACKQPELFCTKNGNAAEQN